MVLSTQKILDQEVNGNSFFNQLIKQLPVLRYSLYVIFPYILLQEFPNYIDHLQPITSEEKILSALLIISSLTTLGYLILRKLFYNTKKILIFSGSALGSSLLTMGANLVTLPFNQLGIIVGLSIAANLSREIARFDSLQYQIQKQTKIIYDQHPDIDMNYKIGKIGLLRISMYGMAIIPNRNLAFDQRQTLSGFLKTKKTEFIENEREIIIYYYEKKEAWSFQYFKLKKKILESYVIFLNGLNDLMK
ncbi:MAG: hypothetical protein HeimC3_13060 [Candidatus Heimdallarchaeota archaeon LC_3]|nr:MAG: hypothetical protein HeimC3_15890 [Candidatus Heimdallarchaeota archaeon LC_3]OLS26032.1 MAG: hypothetical protein HeimC3_13060 [Candidatus Heimdallarchaeota archaeon LC_3]